MPYSVLSLPLAVFVTLLVGCAADIGSKQATNVLRLATTTSTRDSGLLDILLPVFEKEHHCRVDVLAVGTGAALKLGEAGDADVLIVHSRQAELAFMDTGHGIRHEEFMFNMFAILGPEANPAGIDDSDPVGALQNIAHEKYRFLSRGDDSGTHKRELSLWNTSGGRPEWTNYLETGQGMGPTLFIADEMQGYTLTDMGTYLNFRDKLDLIPLVTDAKSLQNPYAVIVVNPEKHERINVTLANTFVDFLIIGDTQQLIEGYQIAGKQLFIPTRITRNQ